MPRLGISLSPKAHYVTQTSVWCSTFTGPLTDAKIRRYALAGRYGRDAQLQAERKQRITKAKLTRKVSQADLLKLLLS